MNRGRLHTYLSLVVLRILGGAMLLWFLSAPSWAVVSWLMLRLRFRLALGLSRSA